MEDSAMIEWRRVLAPFVGLHSIAPTVPAESFARQRGVGRTRQARLWIISTEFLVESEPDESARNGGA
jgi:hypothetical protein